MPSESPSSSPAAVGARVLQIEDATQGATVRAIVLYPARGVMAPVRWGAYEVEVAMGASVEAIAHPGRVILLSHGNGGTSLTHRGTALELARRGHVVALVDHPGNCVGDDGLATSPENLVNRPRHLRLVLDTIDGEAHLPAVTSAVVVGHSFGGYTGLVLAGARPMALDGRREALAIPPDPRIVGLVLLAPAVMWFMAPDALDEVEVPVFLRYGAKDRIIPPIAVATLGPRLRGPVDVEEVPGAGHFSFQTPFPPAMQRDDFLPAQDPPGFDRAAYHPQLNDEIAAWLEALPTS